MKFTKLEKFGKSPVHAISGTMFVNKEAEETFNNAEPAVRKHVEYILNKCINQSMHELCMDHILNRFEEVYERLQKLEEK